MPMSHCVKILLVSVTLRYSLLLLNPQYGYSFLCGWLDHEKSAPLSVCQFRQQLVTTVESVWLVKVLMPASLKISLRQVFLHALFHLQ